MRNLIMALLTPLSPPKNYSFSQRNFAQEYIDMKEEYERKQQQKPVYRLGVAKFDYPLSNSRR
ncbi:MAG: hypothetical protein HYX67_04455 [Candidatus Melainabacteria bacterium]|nr:hypothetical protein [Candidatus Melainabacteria bacterium]